METTYSGSCLCGGVRFDVTGAFESFFLCHCKFCQKDTGSAHAANLFSTKATLQWRAGGELVKTYALPGTRHAKGFCGICGAAMPSRQLDGALLVVPAGCLDSTLARRPNGHLFAASKAAWDRDLGELPHFPGLPG